MQIFKKRGEMTKFQILSEISKQNPHIKQKDLSEKIGITIQAVSENIKILIKEGYITTPNGRAPYKITSKGILYVKSTAAIIRDYSNGVIETINHYKTVWPAIAYEDLEKGDKVGLFMKEGVLYASLEKKEAYAEVYEGGKKGFDVTLINIGGTIQLERGEIVIVIVPPVKDGGSKTANLKLIKELYEKGLQKGDSYIKFERVGILGTISRSIAHQLEIPYDFEFATTKAAISATKRGLNVLLILVGEMARPVEKKFNDAEVKYTRIDARNPTYHHINENY